MYYFLTALRELYLDWTRSHPGLVLADFYALFDNLVKRPSDFGFYEDYVKVGCIKEKCDENVREYIWFDVRRVLSLFLSFSLFLSRLSG